PQQARGHRSSIEDGGVKVKSAKYVLDAAIRTGTLLWRRFFPSILCYLVMRMSAHGMLAIVASGTVLALGATLLLAQQPDSLTSAFEARYDLYFWWDAICGIPLPSSKDFGDPFGQLRLINKFGTVQTSGHPFFMPLGFNGRSCVTCHQPTSAM